ncbi:hypothetical protein [Agrococcus beijingensis]|uniref:hypothetical protein n=1 Tax=Agrococcus beijingensis TaxID=3068634 RepID=UPI002741F7AE|nr:hypothetical protein [Agrococcus sp. REN33]
MPRLILPLLLVSALALAGCSSSTPEPSPAPSGGIGPLPGASEPATEPAPSESPVTAEGDPNAPEGYPIAPATAFPECAALEDAVAPLIAGLTFDQEVSDAQDQEDIAVERQCAWVNAGAVASDRTVRLTLSGIPFAPEELVSLSGSRLVVTDPAANQRGLFVMGVGEPPVLADGFAGNVNVFDQFNTVSVGFTGADSGFTGQQAVDSAVAVHEILRG